MTSAAFPRALEAEADRAARQPSGRLRSAHLHNPPPLSPKEGTTWVQLSTCPVSVLTGNPAADAFGEKPRGLVGATGNKAR